VEGLIDFVGFELFFHVTMFLAFWTEKMSLFCFFILVFFSNGP
jgi:hypothetical protein